MKIELATNGRRMRLGLWEYVDGRYRPVRSWGIPLRINSETESETLSQLEELRVAIVKIVRESEKV